MIFMVAIYYTKSQFDIFDNGTNTHIMSYDFLCEKNHIL
jgi:hypothetical protein